MARTRMLKAEFFHDEELVALGWEAMILFEGLWTMADREGRLKDQPAVIHGHIFPFHPDVDVSLLLQKLHNSRHIQRYIVDGKGYILVVNFTKHQHPHRNEIQSVIPGPNGTKRLPRKSEVTSDNIRSETGGLINTEYGIRNTDTDTDIRVSKETLPIMKKPKLKEPSGLKPLIDYFCDKWQERFTNKYPFAAAPARNAKTMKAVLVAAGDLETAKRLVDSYLLDDDQWVKGKGHDITCFGSRIARYLAVKKSPPRETPTYTPKYEVEH